MPLMHITGDVSAGTLLTIATLVGIAIRFGRQLGNFETTLKMHAVRLDSHESRMLSMVGDLQRVIGRVEIVQALEAKKNGAL